MMFQIPREIFDFFAAHPVGPMLSFDLEASDPRDVLREPLETFLSSFSAEEVASVQASKDFQFFAGRRPDKDRAARVWLGERRLAIEIARRRLEVITQDLDCLRPRPYAAPALGDLQIDDHHLAPLAAFRFDGARLVRNEFAFLLLPTTGAPNSTYWLLATIYEQGLAPRTRVRLDPFLSGPVATFPEAHHRMWLYGRALDWERIRSLKEPEHGRWMPDSPLSRGQFTDYAWTPRDDEVHFVCEEIPSVENIGTEPARYLHAIYSRRSRTIEHLDGAIRIYSREEIGQRTALHARNAGKMGVRQKVFAIGGALDPDVLSQVAQTFFVWNSDVQQYFGNTIAMGSTA